MADLTTVPPYNPGKNTTVTIDGREYNVKVLEAAMDFPDVEGSMIDSIQKALQTMKSNGVEPFDNNITIRKGSDGTYNLAFYEKDAADLAVVELPISSRTSKLDWTIKR